MFGERLKKLRENKELSQEKLGEIVGAAKTTVSGWENGGGTPGYDILIKLAKLFGCTTDHLLGNDDVYEDPNEQELIKHFRPLKKDEDKKKINDIVAMVTENMDRYQD